MAVASSPCCAWLIPNSRPSDARMSARIANVIASVTMATQPARKRRPRLAGGRALAIGQPDAAGQVREHRMHGAAPDQPAAGNEAFLAAAQLAHKPGAPPGH